MEEEKQIEQLAPQTNHQPQRQQLSTATSLPPQTNELDIRQILAMVRRRAILSGSVAIAVCGGIWFWALTSEARYAGSFQLLVEPATADSKLAELTQSDPNSNQSGGLDYETQIQILQSPKLIEPVLKQVTERYGDITYSSLLKNLTISRLETKTEKTKIIIVNYQDSEPQKVQFVLQNLADEYLSYSLRGRQTNLTQGSQFINSQLPILQKRVNLLQGKLQQFRQQYNFIEPEIQAQQLAQQVSNIKLQRLETQKQLAEVRALYKFLHSSGGVEALKDATVYQKLLEQVSVVDNQLATESTRFQADSPALQQLSQKRENLLALLQQEKATALGNRRKQVENQISQLEIRAKKIAQAQSDLNQQIKQTSTLVRQYTDLQQKLKIATESLNRFLETRESLQIETAQKEIPWILLTTPQLPQAPISPNVPRNLLLGVVAGFVAGTGAGLLAEKLDNVLHTRNDLKQLTLPILGLIPFCKDIKRLTPLAAAIKPKSLSSRIGNKNTQAEGNPFLEAFRSLQINLKFLFTLPSIRSVVISSAAPGDGKSTVAVHLAQAAAAMGRRVLLVDADLRRPEIHTRFGISNELGLSDVISKNLTFLDVMQRSPIGDNLFLLTSGKISPDPCQLLSTKKMQKLVEQLQQHFDLVIYDTPPILGFGDTMLLATYTDGILFVVRMGNTDRAILMQALDRLRTSQSTILGIVANGIKHDYITQQMRNYRRT